MMNAIFSLICSPMEIKHPLGGFSNMRDCVTAASLSVLCAKRNKLTTILYSDNKAADTLSRLGVFFDKYDTRLADKNIPGEWWTLGKVETYGMQSQPFIHYDNDAFVFDPIQKKDVICQGRDYEDNYYNECIKNCKDAGCVFPEYLDDFIQLKDYDQLCLNTGIFGGTNIPAINAYAQSALKFVNDNKSAWEKLKNFKTKSGLFAIQEITVMVEQLCMTAYMYSIKQEVTSFNPGRYCFVNNERSYIHMAGTLKKDPFFINLMHEKMMFLFPNEYYRILENY